VPLLVTLLLCLHIDRAMMLGFGQLFKANTPRNALPARDCSQETVKMMKKAERT
jgi:hypothetical protein